VLACSLVRPKAGCFVAFSLAYSTASFLQSKSVHMQIVEAWLACMHACTASSVNAAMYVVRAWLAGKCSRFIASCPFGLDSKALNSKSMHHIGKLKRCMHVVSTIASQNE
jgi:hypothetical protein